MPMEVLLLLVAAVLGYYRRADAPQGYPYSVSPYYMGHSLWRGVQGISSQVSGVLSTQALLSVVGLEKGVIPTAATVNWVLKDGIGYKSEQDSSVKVWPPF